MVMARLYPCLIPDPWMEIILRGVDDDRLLPADDGMPWHVKNQIICLSHLNLFLI